MCEKGAKAEKTINETPRFIRGATANLSQARPNILTQIFLTGCFLQERIETQNLGKAQALWALPTVAPLNQMHQHIFTIQDSSF